MATRETVREMTNGQLKELIAAVIEGIPTDLTFDTAKRWIGNKRKLGTSLRAMLADEQNKAKALTFDVTTDARTGEEHIAALQQKGFRVDDYAKQVLRSKEFVATNGVVYKLAVIMASEFEDAARTNATIRAEAANRGYLDPAPEMAPYLREMISDEELQRLGLWGLVIMHQPIADSDGYPGLLGLDRDGDGRWLDSFDGQPDNDWGREVGFVFLVPAST